MSKYHAFELVVECNGVRRKCTFTDGVHLEHIPDAAANAVACEARAFAKEYIQATRRDGWDYLNRVHGVGLHDPPMDWHRKVVDAYLAGRSRSGST
jgi:hypothetical protein